MKRLVCIGGLLAATLGLACPVLLIQADSAFAGSNHFCPPASGSQVLISANDRCASGVYYTLQQVGAVLSNGSGVDHCAVGKQSAGGFGGNVIDPGCGTYQYQETPCVSARQGYATIVNRSSSAHYYWGWAGYGNWC